MLLGPIRLIKRKSEEELTRGIYSVRMKRRERETETKERRERLKESGERERERGDRETLGQYEVAVEL